MAIADLPPQARAWRLYFLAALVFAITAFLSGYGVVARNSYLHAQAGLGTATIREKLDEGSALRVFYKLDAEGRELVLDEVVPPKLWGRLEVGGTWTALYPPGRPEEATLAGGEQIGASNLVVYTGLCVFFATLALYCLLAGMKLKAQTPEGRTVTQALRAQLGELPELEFHEKKYPAYELGSLSRAIDALREESSSAAVLGASGRPIKEVLESPWLANQTLSPLSYRRIPVSANEESSAVDNALYAFLRDGVPVVLHLLPAHVASEAELDDKLAGAAKAGFLVQLGSPTREVTDRTFARLDAHLRSSNLFRGKVLDLRIEAGGVADIRYKATQQVEREAIVLSDGLLETVEANVVRFFEHKETLRNSGIELKRGVLLHGLPGTGKTLTCLYLARKLEDFTVFFVSGPSLHFPREICKLARYLQPSLVVMEDVDLLALQRDDNQLIQVLGELLNQMDGCEPNDEVVFVLTTNAPERIEPALRDRPGRIDARLGYGLPGPAEREDLLRLFGRGLVEGSLDGVIAASEALTPATLKELVKRASVRAAEAGRVKEGRVVLDDAQLLDALRAFEQEREEAPA